MEANVEPSVSPERNMPALTASPVVTLKSTPLPKHSSEQEALLRGARSTLGDTYDDGYYAGGVPPDGRGACTDVIYQAYLAAGINLQEEIEKDIALNAYGYPNLGDRNINYRRAPNLIVWFERHTKSLPIDADFQPGDIVFWSLLNDGVADHVGVVAEREGIVVHNIGPRCREDAALHHWPILGHFRI